MNIKKQAFDTYINRIIYISQNVSISNKIGKMRTFIKGSKGKTFTLLDNIANEYDKLVKKILSEKNWINKFSEKYIEKRLDSIIVEVISSSQKDKVAKILLKDLIDELVNYNRKLTVIIPISGLSIELNRVKIGKVDLFTMTKEISDELLEKIEDIILHTQATDNFKQKLKKNAEESIKNMHGNVCTEFCVTAEPIRARERAEEETRRVIDIIRYFIPILYRDKLRVNVSLIGEMIPIIIRFMPIISSDSKFFQLAYQKVGSLNPFELNDRNIKKMEKMGAFELSDILAKPKNKLSNFEETLLRSLHWFSSSQAQFEIENKFLNLIVCLETLLTPRDRDPIANYVAEGVAILLTKGYKNRKELKSRVKKMYKLRSAISHGGKKEIFESDIKELQNIARLLIKIMIKRRNEFISQKDILDWIEEQKLA